MNYPSWGPGPTKPEIPRPCMVGGAHPSSPSPAQECMHQGSRRWGPALRSNLSMEDRVERGVSGAEKGPTSTSPVQNAGASNLSPSIETPADPGPSPMTCATIALHLHATAQRETGAHSSGSAETIDCAVWLTLKGVWSAAESDEGAGGGFTQPGACVSGERALTRCAHRITPWCVLPATWRGTIPLTDLGSQPRHHPSHPNSDGSRRSVGPRWTRAPAAA